MVDRIRQARVSPAGSIDHKGGTLGFKLLGPRFNFINI